MSTRITYILLGCLAIIGSQTLINASPVSTTAQEQNGVVRSDYIYTPEIGYHKLHTVHQSWFGAKRVCQQEGAELSIVNSEGEAEVLAKYMREAGCWEALVGVNNIDNADQWVTIHGLPISKTGFEEWDESEPSNAGEFGEHCAVLRKNKKLNDVSCYRYYRFFCELVIA